MASLRNWYTYPVVVSSQLLKQSKWAPGSNFNWKETSCHAQTCILRALATTEGQNWITAVAVIIGIAEYQRTEVPAIFADEDAKFFYDYATLKLGVPEQNIIELLNQQANEIEIALAVENFLKRKITRNETDVYVFYAGHGLAKDDGSEMYLLPYDGAPQLLERTAISRKQLFSDIASAKPRSVTVFLDTCYSGTTRGAETLIASRPIAIKAKPRSIPRVSLSWLLQRVTKLPSL